MIDQVCGAHFLLIVKYGQEIKPMSTRRQTGCVFIGLSSIAVTTSNHLPRKEG